MLKSIKKVLLVVSGKGGVGKSSVAVQLALTLALQNFKVGILDVDLCGPSIPRMLNLMGARITQGPQGWLPVVLGEAQPSLKVVSIGFLLSNQDDAVIWRGPKKTAMITQFLTDVDWGELDFLVVDTPPGTSDEHIALLENFHSVSTGRITEMEAIIVTTPQLVALADVTRIIGFCKTVNLPIGGIVENMSGYCCPHCHSNTNVFSKGGGEQLAQRYELPFLGSIPIYPAFSRLVERNDTNILIDYPQKCGDLLCLFQPITAQLTQLANNGNKK